MWDENPSVSVENGRSLRFPYDSGLVPIFGFCKCMKYRVYGMFVIDHVMNSNSLCKVVDVFSAGDNALHVDFPATFLI